MVKYPTANQCFSVSLQRRNISDYKSYIRIILSQTATVDLLGKLLKLAHLTVCFSEYIYKILVIITRVITEIASISFSEKENAN